MCNNPDYPEFDLRVIHNQIWFAKELDYTPWLAALNKANGTAEYEDFLKR